MKFKKEKKEKIINEIIKKIDRKLPFYDHIMEKYKISRQTIRNYLKELVEDNVLIEEGIRNKKYTLKELELDIHLKIKGLKEDEVFKENVALLIQDCPENFCDIVEYIFTEMLNNVIDHSKGKEVYIGVMINYLRIFVMIGDDGIGIFRNIKNKKNLSSESEAIFELAKGKLTTDKKNHTGEGIFFSSRASGVFRIESFGEIFTGIDEKDTLKHMNEEGKTNFSTTVCFLVEKNTKKTLVEIFDKYTDDDYGFAKTHILVSLFKEFEKKLISRSQAKRFLNGLNKFKEITFDYKGIEIIGQGFADQIYRIFYRENPEVILHNINTNKEIEFMIKRAISNR